MNKTDLEELHQQIFSAIIGIPGEIVLAIMAEATAHVLKDSGVQTGTPHFRKFEKAWREMLLRTMVSLECQQANGSIH